MRHRRLKRWNTTTQTMETKGFSICEIFMNVLVRFYRFIWIPVLSWLWVFAINILFLTVREWTLDVRFRRLKSMSAP